MSTEWPPLEIPRRVRTGSESIDTVLGGGFKIGQVTEICGESGIGKTILCMQAVVADRYYLSHIGVPSMAIYVTCRCTFPVTRLRDICKKYYDEGPRIAMENVLILNADNPQEWQDVLVQMKAILESQETEPKKTRVIVIDAISALFSYPCRSRDELEEQANHVKSTGFALQRFAHKYNLAILVCNWAINSVDVTNPLNFETSGRLVRPTVGKAWEKKLASRVLLTWEMNATGTEWIRQISQVKGDDANSGKVQFFVKEEGVVTDP